MTKRPLLISMLALLAIVLGAALAGCNNTSTTTATTNATTQTSTTKPATTTPSATTPSGNRITLTGAGATFPAPLYTKMFAEYAKVSNTDVNYQPIGSGGGINQITAKTVDFGASDGIMTDAQLAAATGKLLHIPMTSGAVALAYNLPGIQTGLKLTPDIIADMFLKKITKWNDARIAAINPGINLPAMDVTIVHRSDSSGTTYIFTNYLSKVSQTWSTQVGNATAVTWPGDIGGQGNAGVAGQVQQIQGAIGYVELAYVLQNNMTYASVQNASGAYVAPSLAATTAAAVGVALPDDMKVMITNSTNPAAYPIAGFTWILVYQNLDTLYGAKDSAKAQALVNYLWWGIHDGQQYGAGLYYAALSPDAVKKAEAEINSIVFNGQALHK